MRYDNGGELQQKVLAGIVQNDESRAIAYSLLTQEHFSHDGARKMFEVLSRMYERGEEISLVTAGINKPTEYPLNCITEMLMVRPAEMEALCIKLEDIRQGMQINALCKNAIQRIEHEKTTDIVTALVSGIEAVGCVAEREKIISGKEQSLRALDSIGSRMEKDKRNSQVIYTRFKKLNQATGGFEAGDLIILSGPTGSGKSAFCQNLAQDISVKQTIPFLYVNSEMSEQQIDFRFAAMLSDHAEASLPKIRAGEISQDAYNSIAEALDRLYRSKFWSVTVPDLRIEKVINIVRRHHKQEKIRAVAVDYIGRMDFSSAKDEQKEWMILTGAARRLKTLAQQLGIVVFMVAQVKKDGSLQMASYMENEADLHLMLEPMGEEEVAKYAAQLQPWNYKLHIKKGRNAPRGNLLMHFYGEKLIFRGEE